MKKMYLTMLILAASAIALRGQNFVFPSITTPVGCSPADSYTLYPSFSLEKIVVTQVYNDDGVTGSFAFDVYVHIVNFFDGTVQSTGNFYNYTPTLYSSLSNVPASISNSSTNIPLGTASIASIPSSTNPTFVGSASALGLVLNGAYTSPDTLALFGYDSASLEVNLPCIGDVVEQGTITPLPVIMSALNARVIGGKVTLYWTTYSEQNHMGFRIQRSTDAKLWGELDWLPNANKDQTKIQIEYSYLDQSPPAGDNYYRVIQQDNDGKNKQSNIVRVKLNKRTEMEYSVYPNPVSDMLRVKVSGQQVFNYKLRNAVGMLVAEGNNVQALQEINVKHLASGFYLLQVDDKIYRVEISR